MCMSDHFFPLFCSRPTIPENGWGRGKRVALKVAEAGGVLGTVSGP